VEDNAVAAANTLLDHGAKVNTADKLGSTALIYAAENGNDPLVRTLLQHGAEINVNPGDTALMAAAEGGRLQTVQTLLAHGADVNATGVNGWTALMYAACSGSIPCVQLLLKHGANIKPRTRGGKSIIELVRESDPSAKYIDMVDEHEAHRLKKERMLHFLKQQGPTE